MKRILRYVALMLFFGAIGLSRFTEHVQAANVLGLFATGTGFGVSLAGLISVVRLKQGGT